MVRPDPGIQSGESGMGRGGWSGGRGRRQAGGGRTRPGPARAGPGTPLRSLDSLLETVAAPGMSGGLARRPSPQDRVTPPGGSRATQASSATGERTKAS